MYTNKETEKFFLNEIKENKIKITENGKVFNIKNDNKEIGRSINHGYYSINYYNNNKPKRIYVHRLIYLYFYGEIDLNLRVNHKDGDKLNNHKDNLELATPSENTKHAHDNNLINKKSLTGVLSPSAKFNNKQIQEIKNLKENGIKTIEIAKIFNVNRITISKILNNKSYNLNTNYEDLRKIPEKNIPVTKINQVEKEKERIALQLVYDGILRCTEDGHVYRYDTNNWIGTSILNNCYYYINSTINNKKIYIRIHRLIYLVFNGPLVKPYVNHIDGNKLNNHKNNLECVTPAENIRHAVNTGLTKKLKGEKNYNAKLTNNDVIEMRGLYQTGQYTYQELAKIFNINDETVRRIILNQRWTHIELTSENIIKPIMKNSKKLNKEKAKEIRDLYTNGIDIKKISEMYNVNKTCINNIINNLTYKN